MISIPRNMTMIGRVIDNDDPHQQNRVKVEIPDLSDLNESYKSKDDKNLLAPQHLPWYPVRYSGINNQNSKLPEVDSWVIVEFMDDTLYNGVVIGCYVGVSQE